MIVETVRFNPSVCTCGEHGCEPKFRMEKRVLWTDKEIVTREQEEKKAEEKETDPNKMPTEKIMQETMHKILKQLGFIMTTRRSCKRRETK